MILMGFDEDNSYMSYDHQVVRRCYGNGDEMGSSFDFGHFLTEIPIASASAGVLDIYSGPDDMFRQ
jgi:hypothetical protein